MEKLSQKAAQESRALFFFSGHGLELHQEQQVLLPSDYLLPPERSWNDAISVRNLKYGLASLEVCYHFFFLDACRNDHQALRAKKVTGAEILKEDESALVNWSQVAPMLYATASGQQAFQQSEPSKGISIFGKALLDGLTGTPDIELNSTPKGIAVNLYPLEKYVKRRVVELLKAANAGVQQPVKFSGVAVEDEPITYLPRRMGRVQTVEPPSAEQLLNKVQENLDETFSSCEIIDSDKNSRISKEWTLAHDIFGSEHATMIWSPHVDLFSYSDKKWKPNTLIFHKVERSHDTQKYRIEVSISEPDPIGNWLQLVDTSGLTHGCTLPGDNSRSPREIRYVIESDLNFEQELGSGRRIDRLEVYLSRENEDGVAAAAEIWDYYRLSDVGTAASLVERNFSYLNTSPLAAMVAGLVLLRCNRSSNFSHLAQYSSLPDLKTFWATELMRRRVGLDDLVDASKILLRGGVPFTAEGLSYAIDVSDRLLRVKDLPEVIRKELVVFDQRLTGFLRYFRPGGLFAVYEGFPKGEAPH